MRHETPCLEIHKLSKTYQLQNGKTLLALDQIDLSIEQGEFFSLVGESGSGKTTLAKCILRIIQPDSGSVWIDGENWFSLKGKQLREKRRLVQFIFQDPYTSLNPLFKVEEVVKEPLKVQRIGSEAEQKKQVSHVLEMVGFPSTMAQRYPHELSGGQRQRVAIARALITEPILLIADEPVSSLDQDLQKQLTSLFASLCKQSGVTLLYISHDLKVVRKWSSRIGVMYQGKLLEVGSVQDIVDQPKSDYTRRLVQEAFHQTQLNQ